MAQKEVIYQLIVIAMIKEYADHWANFEDMHLLSRLRIGQFLVNYLNWHGYVRDENYKAKDPYYMTDDELLKQFRNYYNGLTQITNDWEPVTKPVAKPRWPKSKVPKAGVTKVR